jgi:large subunit ribosomal protein L15
VKLHQLKPPPGSRKRKIRVGRGEAGRRGKTAGRGTKGTGARNKLRRGFEGGQMPIARRIPKLRGFNRPQKELFTIVNVGRLADLDTKGTIGPEELRKAGLVKKRGRVKVLGEGELSQALTVRAHAFSLGAVEKIKAAGGTVEVID